jgi:trehalose 2-sulfotransferase
MALQQTIWGQWINPMPGAYIICGTPRTGSTLLCDLLAATRIAGSPDSFFMSPIDPRWARQWQLPIRGNMGEADFNAAYLKAVIKAGRGGTEVFGLRLMEESLAYLSDFLRKLFPHITSDKARLERAFDSILYIHLRRADKAAQAISRVMAEQTGLWHAAPDGTEIERLAPAWEPHYDFNRIARQVAQLEHYEAAWVSWFSQQGIKPLRVDYESLSADPAAALDRICSALGLSPPHRGSVKPGTAKLSNETNSDWLERYRLDCGHAR